MGKSLADTVIHVPMLLRYRASRRVGSGVRVDASVQLVDVVPTVCDLVGVARPKRLDGRSLLAASDDPPRVVLSELYTEGRLLVSAREFPWKLVVDEETGGETLYALDGPEGERPVSRRKRPPEEVVERLRSEAKRYLALGK